MFDLSPFETFISREAMMNAALHELPSARRSRKTSLSLTDYTPSADVRHFPTFLNRLLIPLIDAFCAHYTALTDLSGEVNTGRKAFDAVTASLLAAFERSTADEELNALAEQTQHVRALHAKRATPTSAQAFVLDTRFAMIRIMPDSKNQPAALSLRDYVRVTDSAFGAGAAATFYDAEMARGWGSARIPFAMDIPIERFVFELAGVLSLPVTRRELPSATFLLPPNYKNFNPAPAPVPGAGFPDTLPVLASRAAAAVGEDKMNRFWSAVEAAINRRFVVHMLLKNLDVYALGMENTPTAAAFEAFPEVVEIAKLFGIPDTVLNDCADKGINIRFRIPRSLSAYISAARTQQRTTRTAGMSSDALLNYAKFVASLAVSARASRNIPWGVGKVFISNLMRDNSPGGTWGFASAFPSRFVIAHKFSSETDFCAGHCVGAGAFNARIGLSVY
jgi:hypothetical protein